MYNKFTRRSNIELLRIIAMFLIVAHHFGMHSQYKDMFEPNSLNGIWVTIMQTGGKIGVNIFVLISGYFLCENESFKPGRLLKIWLTMFFYSIVLYLFVVAIGFEEFHVVVFRDFIFPFTYDRWWFASTYLILYAIHPLLNIIIQYTNAKVLRNYIIAGIVFWVALYTISDHDLQSNALLWFICLYFIAYYIKKLEKSDNRIIRLFYSQPLVCFACALSGVVAMVGIKILYMHINADYLKSMIKESAEFSAQSVLVVLVSIMIFICFINLKVKENTVVNYAAQTTFGIYLFHEHFFMRDYIWGVFVPQIIEEKKFVITSVISIIIVFFIGMVIEIIRREMIEKKVLEICVWVDSRYKNFVVRKDV